MIPAPSATPAPLLELCAISKRFGSLVAVESLSVSVQPGEFIAVVGPSGSGKSTLLNMISGLDQPSSGEVRLQGRPVQGPNPNVGFMLQKDLLLPWRSIVKNVEFGLEARPVPRAQRREKAMEELRRCHLEAFADYYPRQLSGGMRQRAALARTLAISPELILLDEPFSALDAQTKLLLQNSFAETISSSGITTVLITHDLTEAVVMADRVLVLSERPGRVLEDIVLDLPPRAAPQERRVDRRINDYLKHLFALLKLNERAA